MCRIRSAALALPDHYGEDRVSMRGKLRTLLLCLPLLLGSIVGAPMRPEEVEELMHCMNQQKMSCTIRQEAENGGDATKRLPEQRL